jgi:hypothetical protein
MGTSQATPKLSGSVTEIQPPPAVNEDETLYLIGRPSLGEDLGFLTTQVVPRDRREARKAAQEWRAANDVVGKLQAEEAGWADRPLSLDLDPEVIPQRDRLLANEAFRRSIEVVPIDVKMVELDRLVVPQKYINLSNVQSVQRDFAADASPKSIFEICMPMQYPRDSVRCLRTNNDTFVFVSRSHDLRFLDVSLLDASQIADDPTRGVVASGVGIMVGYSCNCVVAMEVQNRLVLVNGTHRALALRRLGYTHAPCVIQKISRPEERMLVGPSLLNRNPAEFLNNPRPIVLKDFLDPRLHVKVHLTRRVRQVKVSFSVETLDAPVPE